MIKRILYFIQQAGVSMQFPRTLVRSLGNAFDTVASHSYHVSVIAYCLPRMEGLTHEEGLDAMAMGIFHDLAEVRTGDLDYVAKHYTQFETSLLDNEGTTHKDSAIGVYNLIRYVGKKV